MATPRDQTIQRELHSLIQTPPCSQALCASYLAFPKLDAASPCIRDTASLTLFAAYFRWDIPYPRPDTVVCAAIRCSATHTGIVRGLQNDCGQGGKQAGSSEVSAGWWDWWACSRLCFWTCVMSYSLFRIRSAHTTSSACIDISGALDFE